MDEPEPNDTPRRRFWSRVFLVVFFGLAILISISTILGTWRQQEAGDDLPPDLATTTTAQP